MNSSNENEFNVRDTSEENRDAFGCEEDDPETYGRPSEKLQAPSANALDKFVTKVPEYQQPKNEEEIDGENEEANTSAPIADLHKQHFEHTK